MVKEQPAKDGPASKRIMKAVATPLEKQRGDFRATVRSDD